MTSVQITVEVDPEWIEFCTQWSDPFLTSYIGYWARGVERDPELGWLVFEHGDDAPPSSVAAATIEAWRAGAPLPPQYHRLDTAAALRAWSYGVQRWGRHWYQDGDGPTYDCAIQSALLGEIRYG